MTFKENTKPEARLIGADGNIFNLIAIASQALKNAGQYELVNEMTSRIFESKDYYKALKIISEYVEVV